MKVFVSACKRRILQPRFPIHNWPLLKKIQVKIPHMKKPEILNTAEGQVAVPVSVRLPAAIAFKLYLYCEQMGTSPGKMLASLLEDAFPAFEGNSDTKVTLRIPQVYKAMGHAKLLHGVREGDLADRILKRTEPGGELGRPRKARSVE